jgi:hypothetical protein
LVRISSKKEILDFLQKNKKSPKIVFKDYPSISVAESVFGSVCSLMVAGYLIYSSLSSKKGKGSQLDLFGFDQMKKSPAKLFNKDQGP